MQKFFTGSTIEHSVGQVPNRYPFPLTFLAEQSRISSRVIELRALCRQLRDKLIQARHTHVRLAQAWVDQVGVA